MFDEAPIGEDVRTRLIFAGMRELEEHGVNDFSLRRVAATAEVSCAAPYRHFKSREDLILAILRFIRERFLLFCDAVRAAHGQEPTRLCVELSLSMIRFWVSNPKLFSVLFLTTADAAYRAELEAFDRPLADALAAFGKTSQGTLALVWGYTVLFVRGAIENSAATFRTVRSDLEREIQA